MRIAVVVTGRLGLVRGTGLLSEARGRVFPAAAGLTAFGGAAWMR
jgi:hypothetical protein